VKDIGAAGLTNIVKGEFQGKLGAALNAAGAGLTVATMIVSANILNFEKREADMTAGGKRVDAGRKLAKKGDVKGLEALIGEQEEQVDKSKKMGFVESLLKSFGTFVGTAGGLREMSPEQRKLVEERSQVLDQNKGVDVKSQESFLAQLEAMRVAAAGAAAELAKIKQPPGAGKSPDRNTPIVAR